MYQKSCVVWLRHCLDEWLLIKPDVDLYLNTIFEALRFKAENTDITDRWRIAAQGFETPNEMIESAKQVKQGRSSFRLSVEQIIHGGEVVHNIVWEATKLHFAGVHCSHIKMGLVCPLFKSPTRTRPVTLLHGIDKICVQRIAAAEAVILRQTASPHHFGGMPGRSMNTAHQITMMLWDQVEADENDVNIHFDYTDSSSAFDSSQHCILPAVWKPHHLPHNVARIRLGSITGHRRLFRIDQSITSLDQCASLGGGGAQGRATSGTVWQATLDLVISALNSSVHPLAHSNIEFTTTLGESIKVLTVLFIDDTVTPSDADREHDTIRRVAAVCASLGVVCNFEKTERLPTFAPKDQTTGVHPTEQYNALNKAGRYKRGQLRYTSSAKNLGVTYKAKSGADGKLYLDRESIDAKAWAITRAIRSRAAALHVSVDVAKYVISSHLFASAKHILKAVTPWPGDLERHADHDAAVLLRRALGIHTGTMSLLQRAWCFLPTWLGGGGADAPSMLFAVEIFSDFVSTLNGDNEVATKLLRATLHEGTSRYGRVFLHLAARLNLRLHHNKRENDGFQPFAESTQLPRATVISTPAADVIYVVVTRHQF
jgi:hypothetical protein